MQRIIRMTGSQYQQLRTHLFPGDDKEAVALALCGRLESAATQALCVHKIVLIPHDQCSERTSVRVTWPTKLGESLYREAAAKHMAILKIHCHPTDYPNFSPTDDFADKELFQSLHGWTDDGLPHASAVMMTDERIIARFVDKMGTFKPVDRIAIVGDDLLFYDSTPARKKGTMEQLRTSQAFGEKTVNLLSSLTAGVVGCSGTGSWIIEQLSRLGVGRLVMVDADRIELKNLNRIINTRREDARNQRLKVDRLADAVKETGLVGDVVKVPEFCFSEAAIKQLAGCDVLFGCMDARDGRDFLNRIATFYCIPYFDLGVNLNADGMGGVDRICGSVHYVLPGGSTLMTRGVFTPEDIRADALRRTNPEQYQKELQERYIKNARVDSPAVVSINGLCATIAINNFLARIHKFRDGDNSEIRWQTFDLVNTAFTNNPDGPVCRALARYVGRGDMDPPLDSVLT